MIKINSVNLDIGRSFLSNVDISNVLEASFSDTNQWVSRLNSTTEEQLEKSEEIKLMAKEIASNCDILVVISSGSIYLGIKAGVDILVKTENKDGTPEILFAGCNANGAYHKKVLDKIQGKSFYLCVIGKSQLAPESEYAFDLFKTELEKRYGTSSLKQRIIVINGDPSGALAKLASDLQCPSLSFPKETPVTHGIMTAEVLLPLAVGGIDITEILKGAYFPKEENEREFIPMCCGDAGVSEIDLLPMIFRSILYYTVARSIMTSKQKTLEIFNHFDMRLSSMVEWIKHLFVNTKTKIYPSSLEFSNDLLSMGEFLQFGSPIFFETFLEVAKIDTSIPGTSEEDAAFINDMEDLNRSLQIGLMQTQRVSGVPILRIEIPAMTPYYFGQALFFFSSAADLTQMLPE